MNSQEIYLYLCEIYDIILSDRVDHNPQIFSFDLGAPYLGI